LIPDGWLPRPLAVLEDRFVSPSPSRTPQTMMLLFATILLGRRFLQLQLPVRVRLVAHRDTCGRGARGCQCPPTLRAGAVKTAAALTGFASAIVGPRKHTKKVSDLHCTISTPSLRERVTGRTVRPRVTACAARHSMPQHVQHATACHSMPQHVAACAACAACTARGTGFVEILPRRAARGGIDICTTQIRQRMLHLPRFVRCGGDLGGRGASQELSWG
jgi:hypothetical protein